MFRSRYVQEKNLQILEIFDGQETMARFVPERGGILSEMLFAGVPLFFLDKETLIDFNQNVRGGNPVLFPVCGPLDQGRYMIEGKAFFMKQHGIARNKQWEVAGIECDDSARVRLKLAADEETKKVYPFDFVLEFTYEIFTDRVTIKQKYINKSNAIMPMYPGFHPYFWVPGLEVTEIFLPVGSCYDMKKGVSLDYKGRLNLNENPETNLVFSELKAQEAWFKRADGYKISVQFDKNFSFLVLWSLRGREFLCIEPWMGNNNAMNIGEIKGLKPGTELNAEVTYTLSRS